MMMIKVMMINYIAKYYHKYLNIHSYLILKELWQEDFISPVK